MTLWGVGSPLGAMRRLHAFVFVGDIGAGAFLHDLDAAMVGDMADRRSFVMKMFDAVIKGLMGALATQSNFAQDSQPIQFYYGLGWAIWCDTVHQSDGDILLESKRPRCRAFLFPALQGHTAGHVSLSRTSHCWFQRSARTGGRCCAHLRVSCRHINVANPQDNISIRSCGIAPNVGESEERAAVHISIVGVGATVQPFDFSFKPRLFPQALCLERHTYDLMMANFVAHWFGHVVHESRQGS